MANVHVIRAEGEARKQQPFASPVERIYFEWDKALSHNDANALLELYAPDAVIESPLIPHLLGKKEGFCLSREEMRPFLKR